MLDGGNGGWGEDGGLEEGEIYLIFMRICGFLVFGIEWEMEDYGGVYIIRIEWKEFGKGL